MIGALAALWTFAEVEKTVNQVIQERMPAAIDALELSRQAERIASIAPKLLAHSGATEQMRTDRELRSGLVKLEQLLASLKAQQHHDVLLADIEQAITDVRRNLSQLQGLFNDPFKGRDLTGEKLLQADKLLNENSEISRTLTAAVDRFISDERTRIAQANADVTDVQYKGRIVLISAFVFSLIAAALIVWLYVQRSIVRRLTALSKGMLEIARGNLQADLPTSKGNDEIRLMIDALRVFRDTAIEKERFGRLKRFLAPQVAELVVSSGNERVLDSHRREVAVLFCDLRGFTAFAETAEPEEVIRMLSEYHRTLGELVHKFSGTLERFTGDGLIVIFNDPLPCQDPSLTAVKLAIEMRRSVAGLSKHWHHFDKPLGFGIGIAYGFATLGRIGFEERFEYTAIGSVVNLAARLCERASAGEVLIDGKVHAEIAGRLKAEQLGDFTPKGFSRPIKVFNITDVSN